VNPVPNVLQREQIRTVDFVASPALDLLNCMYFTYLAGQIDGVEEWPIRTRAAMDPALREELDLFYSYPRREPGIMGALNDVLFFHRSAWGSADELLRFVRELPAEGTPEPQQPGIQGLALYALRWPGDEPFRLQAGVAPRDTFAATIDTTPVEDFRFIISPDVEGGRDAVLALYDNPDQVRARVLSLISRFYDEHYGPDEERRVRCMERSAARYRGEDTSDIDAVIRRVTGRHASCIQEKSDNYTQFIFVPSVDAGPYNSCADLPPLHGLHYPCDPEPSGVTDDAISTHRLAQVYRALSDEQRLRILRDLREGELYAQEIVARTGLNQPVVSRHLAFLKAVGLVNVRRQNNMKFFSLNSAMRDELRQAVDQFLPSANDRERD
jgi:ArsR family transcriptional regulator, arsenate/arsenite/antimonite-responsive transcriptional repressor